MQGAYREVKKMKKVKISFPSFGVYTEIFKHLFENLGCEVVLPPKSTIKTIQKGGEVSPKMQCVPMKWNIGNYIEALEKNNDLTLIHYNSCGRCRLHTYYIVMTSILKDLGFKFDGIYTIRPNRLLQDFKKITKASYFKIISSIIKGFKEMKKVEEEHFKSKGDIRIGVIGEIFCILDDNCNLNLFRKLKERNCCL